MPVRGLNSELYFNMAKCKYLGHRAIYFMKTKDEVVDTVRQYILETRMIDKQVYCEYKLDLTVTDSDKLYMSSAFANLEREHNLSPCTPPLEPVRCSGVWLLEPEPARSRHRSRSRFRRPDGLPPSTAAAGAAVPAIGYRP
jgi:hypothetical protein